MYKLTLQQGHDITTMVWVGAVAVLLVGIFYFRTFRTLRRGQWQALLALRIVAILIIVLLMFRPVLSYYKELDQRKSVIFLLDTSSSMSISDSSGGRPRLDQARDQIASWHDRLARAFDIHLIEFSERARSLEDVGQLDALFPDGRATSLSRALVAAAKKVPRQDIEAVFLVSDGVHNSARRPEDVAAKMSVPVHTVGVGASLRNDVLYRDVQVTGMSCPDTLMLNNKARISVLIEGVGLAGRVVGVVLEDDGAPLEETELTLDEVEGSQEVQFEFLPKSQGRHKYTVRVPAVEEEKIEQNNQRSRVALVVEAGIRVLYLEGTLRKEYGALAQRFLSKDPDLEFCSLVRTRANEFLQRTNIVDLNLTTIPSDRETIDTFDVFIIGDLDSSYIKPQQQEMIVRRVRDGAGLLMLGGYHGLGPGGYGDTPLGEIVPVLLGGREIDQVTGSFMPVLTPDGARHPIFANIAGFFPSITGPAKQSGLPDLDGCTRVVSQRPGATVLARCPSEPGPNGDMPVLAVQPVGEGYSAVFCGDTTRKWQQAPRALNQESPFLQFWGQMVRWLAGRASAVEAKASVTGITNKGYYEPEEEILISAVVRDELGEGAVNARVIARVTVAGRGPQEVNLAPVPGSAGHFSGTHVPESPGNHEITIEARLDELTTETDQPLVVEVGRPNLEFEKLDLDEQMLGRIASATGGRYVHVTTADYVVDELDRSHRKKRVQMERSLAWPFPLWTLFVAVLTMEWVLRRRFQLR